MNFFSHRKLQQQNKYTATMASARRRAEQQKSAAAPTNCRRRGRRTALYMYRYERTHTMISISFIYADFVRRPFLFLLRLYKSTTTQRRSRHSTDSVPGFHAEAPQATAYE